MFFLSIIHFCLFESCKLNPQSLSSTQAVHPTLYSIDAGKSGIAAQCWPEIPVSDLDKGQSIYYANCSKCREIPKIEQFSERKWILEIDEMAPKAELNSSEKDLLSKFILSFRVAHSTH